MDMSQVADTGRLVVDSSASTGAALAEPGPKVDRPELKLYLNMAIGATIIVILLVVLALDIWG